MTSIDRAILDRVADAATDAEQDASRQGWNGQEFVQRFIFYLTDPAREAPRSAPHSWAGDDIIGWRCRHCRVTTTASPPEYGCARPAAPAPAATTACECKLRRSVHSAEKGLYCGDCGKPIPETPGPQPVSEPERAAGDDRSSDPKSGAPSSASPSGVQSSPASPVPPPAPADASQGKAITDDTHLECQCGWRGYFRELLHDKFSLSPQGVCPKCQSQFRWQPIYPEASGTAREAPSQSSDSVSASPTPAAPPVQGEGKVRDILDGSRSLPWNREQLGQFVREAWVRWALTQPNPKPSWLVPYAELSEPDKEADRQIGEAIARWTLIGDANLAAMAEKFTPAVPESGLRECPFCGSSARFGNNSHSVVECSKCSVSTLRADWNTRAPSSAQGDWTVDNTVLARKILTRLGYALEPSNDPGANPHVDWIAEILEQRPSQGVTKVGDVELARELLEWADSYEGLQEPGRLILERAAARLQSTGGAK